MSETIQSQSESIEKVSNVYESLRRKKPVTKKDLKNYIKVFLGIDIPDKKICHEHSSPMDYIYHTYFSDSKNSSIINHPSSIVGQETKDDGRTKRHKYQTQTA